MRFLAHVHAYPPNHCAGAELMLHSLLKAMIKRGHEAKVIISHHDFITDKYEDILIYTQKDEAKVINLYQNCDVVITHLDRTQIVMQLAERYGKKIIHLVHNDKQLAANIVPSNRNNLAVFNSNWLCHYVFWSGQKIAITPMVEPEIYRTTPGNCITLINLMPAKGVYVFYELAKRLPKKQFLGVIGGYGKQIVLNPLPCNVKIIAHTINSNMKVVYGQTRILLMPSKYESWGRVGIEAASSGIPTIAHPTPGLIESLGRAGIFANRNDIGLWERHIHFLEKPGIYEDHSKNSIRRSTELDPKKDYDLFEKTVKRFII